MIHIEKLEELYYREPLRRTWDNFYRYRHSDRHDINGVSPYKIVDRILANNIGKSFDLAFRYFCKIVPKYQQWIFLSVFEKTRYWRRKAYSVDSNGSIQKEDSKHLYKGPYKVYSDDYKVMWKDTKSPKHWYTKKELVEQIPYYRIRDDFEPVVVSGQVWEYASKKHPEYVKYKRKQAHKSKMFARQYKKDKEEKIYDLRTFKEKKKLKDMELDNLKRLAHGFDEESFKGEFYHGRKNKRVTS